MHTSIRKTRTIDKREYGTVIRVLRIIEVNKKTGHSRIRKMRTIDKQGNRESMTKLRIGKQERGIVIRRLKTIGKRKIA